MFDDLFDDLFEDNGPSTTDGAEGIKNESSPEPNVASPISGKYTVTNVPVRQAHDRDSWNTDSGDAWTTKDQVFNNDDSPKIWST